MSSDKTKRQLVAAFKKRGGLCMYCDGPTWCHLLEKEKAARVRLGIPPGVAGGKKMIRAAKATREHLVRVVDGGPNGDANIDMACNACNVRRMDSPIDVHRVDMQVMVAAGVHPTNRPRIILDHAAHMKAGRLALRRLRKGVLPGFAP